VNYLSETERVCAHVIPSEEVGKTDESKHGESVVVVV